MPIVRCCPAATELIRTNFRVVRRTPFGRGHSGGLGRMSASEATMKQGQLCLQRTTLLLVVEVVRLIALQHLGLLSSGFFWTRRESQLPSCSFAAQLAFTLRITSAWVFSGHDVGTSATLTRPFLSEVGFETHLLTLEELAHCRLQWPLPTT